LRIESGIRNPKEIHNGKTDANFPDGHVVTLDYKAGFDPERVDALR